MEMLLRHHDHRIAWTILYNQLSTTIVNGLLMIKQVFLKLLLWFIHICGFNTIDLMMLTLLALK